MPTAIITDSTACIPPDLARRYAIDIVPVNLIVGGRTYRDGLDDTTDFYRMLREPRSQPTTAAPSPGAYLERMRAAAAKGADAVVCLTVSAQFSAMYDSAKAAARLAAEELPGIDVRVVDSRNAAMAQGFMVVEAARTAASGASPDQVIERALALADRVGLLVVIDTLEYLARSGRVPRVAAWASQILQLKPIVQFRAGDIKLVARARTRPRAVERLLAAFQERAQPDGPLHVCVHHTNAPADAETLRRRVAEELAPAELFVSEFTQVMGAHTGPGLVGLAFYRG